MKFAAKHDDSKKITINDIQVLPFKMNFLNKKTLKEEDEMKRGTLKGGSFINKGPNAREMLVKKSLKR
jgi:hypothetical protein